jgi:hypothetical protein
MQIVPLALPLAIMFNTRPYYILKQLFAHRPAFEYGFKTKPRNIIEKKKISTDDYVYATFNKKENEWKASTAECKKAQLLLSQEWTDIHYFQTAVPASSDKNNAVPASSDKAVADSKATADSKTEDKYEVAPNLIELKDEEKFTDENGDIIEIETRGEQTENGIYFNVGDVAKGFGMENLSTTLCHTNNGAYSRGIDYVTFIQGILLNQQDAPIKRCLYLTYAGLCRVLFLTRNGHTKRFQDWATNKLFTIQMGEEPEKKKLGAKLCGITVRQVTDVFGKNCADRFPCIYLLSLGTVKALRGVFNIDSAINDDQVVYKFGFTKDFVTRLNQHRLSFGKMEGVNINVVAFHNIDTKFTCDAEGDVRAFCQTFGLKLKMDKYNEIIALTADQLGQVKKQYKYIGMSYAGSTLEMQNKMDGLTTIIKDTNNAHLIAMQEKDNQLLKKDLIIKDLIIKDGVRLSEMLTMQLDTMQKMNALAAEKADLKLREYNSKFGKL